jgi:methylmalonyl-CoA/ethylmalonyl-CoA epimerase
MEPRESPGSTTFLQETLVPNAPRIAHVGIAVADLETAARFYRNVLGLEPHPLEQADGADILSFPLGESSVELLAPRDSASPIARFLERRGPGIHHICYRVADLDAAIAHCREAGYQLIDETPRTGAGGCRIAFIHPRSTSGTLIELTE